MSLNLLLDVDMEDFLWVQVNVFVVSFKADKLNMDPTTEPIFIL